MMCRDYGLFIAGRWDDGQGSGRIERHHPATGDLVATYASGTAVHINRAVAAARGASALPTWGGLTARERSLLLFKAADEIVASADELAGVESRETGKPLGQALEEVLAGAELWRYAASVLRAGHGEFHPHLAAASMGFTLMDPVGVVGLITPWNFPFIVSAERLPFMLAAGCTVVAKPSEYASGTALLTAEVLKRAGIPDGVYNVVTGLGAEAGASLVDHPDVAMISFTGSSENGGRVMAAASRTLKRLSLELGGKSPVLVFADADFDKAADAVIAGFTHNAGQCCIATTRLLVERGGAEQFKAILVDKLTRLPVTQPLATRPQFEKVLSYLERGRKDGIVLFGGSVAAESKGFFVVPTVIDGLPADSPLVREEIFGPVLTVHVFDGEDHAISLANDTAYGLAACVWSGDVGRALRLARRIRAGRLWINAPQENFPELPVGGYGASGIGREAGMEGIRAYCEVKSVIMRV